MDDFGAPMLYIVLVVSDRANILTHLLGSLYSVTEGLGAPPWFLEVGYAPFTSFFILLGSVINYLICGKMWAAKRNKL